MDLLNRAIAQLEAHENKRRRLEESPLAPQQRIDLLNRIMVEMGHDPRQGIVAGDGMYYDRGSYPEH